MKNNFPQTSISFQTGRTARRVLAIATVSATLVLPIGAAIASSHKQPPAGILTLTADQQMLRTEQQMKQLQSQMQVILATTDRQERYRLILGHIKNMRDTLGMMRGMEVTMAANVEQGHVVPHTSLERRHAIMEGFMDMVQIMLERLALQQEPSLYK